MSSYSLSTEHVFKNNFEYSFGHYSWILDSNESMYLDWFPSFAVDNVGKYVIYNSDTSVIHSSFDSREDYLNKLADLYASLSFSSVPVNGDYGVALYSGFVLHSYSYLSGILSSGRRYIYAPFYEYLNFVGAPTCCYPNFAPIVQSLGGIPVTDQPQNLKIICQLLGVDTAENGLIDCDLMKLYLKRVVSFFGGTFSDQPNENLKSICQFLGVDTAENGLTDCDLSKDYVKRNGVMLGAENA